MSPTGRYQFSVRDLLASTGLVAGILAINRWLGPPFGWGTGIPLSIVAMLAMCTRGRATFGAILGFVVFLLLGYYVVIQWNPADARYTKSLVCLASYGGSIGGSFNAIVMKRWVLGYFCLAASFVSLAAISMMRL